MSCILPVSSSLLRISVISLISSVRRGSSLLIVSTTSCTVFGLAVSRILRTFFSRLLLGWKSAVRIAGFSLPGMAAHPPSYFEFLLPRLMSGLTYIGSVQQKLSLASIEEELSVNRRVPA